MSKKRGFTLTEVLVVIALTTLIMTMIGTAFVFVGTSSGDLIDKSEELTQTQSIETYLRGLIDKKTYDIKDLMTKTDEGEPKLEENKIVKLDDKGNLVVNGKIEFKDTGLKSIEIEKYDKFVRCTLKYEKASYDFILGLWRE